MIDEVMAEKERRKFAGLSSDHGYKYAYLFLGEDGVSFAPLRGHSYGYGVSADAVCRYDALYPDSKPLVPAAHKSPHPDCKCGFYALPVRRHLGIRMTASQPSNGMGDLACILEVDVSGDVIDGEVTFRAEHIEVLKVTLPRSCQCCGQPACCMAVGNQTGMLWPSCGAFGCSFSTALSLLDIRNLLPTDIEWSTQ